jgi:AcrR family transcriptional regulator
MCAVKIMARSYNKAKRANQEAETRRKIVDAAVSLHGELGPARTSVSLIAERAGVQRHTVYAHFPDERSMLMACSGQHTEDNPLPDPEAWAHLNATEQRLRAALTALYDWFDANAAMTSNVLRDAEHHDVLREIVALRFGPAFDAIIASLAPGLTKNALPQLHLALSFYTWRTLTRETGLTNAQATESMVAAVLASGEAQLDAA